MSEAEERYDFRFVSPADDSIGELQAWLNRASDIFEDHWQKIATHMAKPGVGRIKLNSFEKFMNSADPSIMGFVVNLKSADTDSVMLVSQNDLHKVANLMIGCPDLETPERELTATELALGQLFIDTIISSLRQAWPSQEEIEIELKNLDLTPKRSRLFEPATTMMVMKIAFQVGENNADIYWLAPRDKFAALFDVADSDGSLPGVEVEDAVQQIPVELVVILGQTRLPMNQLSELQAGDLLKLDQRIDETLLAKIDGKPRYECWPGKIGSQQGLEIATIL